MDSLSKDEGIPAGVVSDFTRYLFQVLVWVFLCGVVGLIGIGTNIINLVVFIRQGILTESVTASLAGLSVADLCCVTTMFFHSVNHIIVLTQPSGIPWDPLSVTYIATGWTRVMFTRVTCWITAYVALERCMCVVLPFKVKQLFTAARSILVISCIFVFIMASYIPIFYTQRLQNVRDPTTNITKVRMVLTEDADNVENITRHTNDIILPTLSLTIVILCTHLTISRLNISTKWRRKNANANFVRIQGAAETSDNNNTLEMQGVSNKHVDNLNQRKQKIIQPDKTKTSSSDSTSSNKETKVVKMILFICIIFIICNSPCVIIFYTRIFIPKIAVGNRYHNLFFVVYSLDFLLETLNSSINIVVYYKMSTKYKQEFRRLFGMKDDN